MPLLHELWQRITGPEAGALSRAAHIGRRPGAGRGLRMKAVTEGLAAHRRALWGQGGILVLGGLF